MKSHITLLLYVRGENRTRATQGLLVPLLAKKKRKRRSVERKVHVCASYMYYPEGCTQECIIHFSLICVQTKRSQCPPLVAEVRHRNVSVPEVARSR